MWSDIGKLDGWFWSNGLHISRGLVASVPRAVEDRRGLESSGSCCVTATARYVDYSFSSCVVASARDNIIVASTSAPDSYISASRLLLMSVLFLLLFPRFLRLSLRLCLV